MITVMRFAKNEDIQSREICQINNVKYFSYVIESSVKLVQKFVVSLSKSILYGAIDLNS